MDEFFDWVIAPLLIVAAAFGLVFGLFSLFEASDHDSCHDKGELAQVQVTYRKWDGCYVNQNGLWIPLHIWQYNREHGIGQ